MALKKATEVENVVDGETFCPIGVGPLVSWEEFVKRGGRHASLKPNRPLGILLPATGECGFTFTEEAIALGARRTRKRCQLCDRICFEKEPKEVTTQTRIRP